MARRTFTEFDAELQLRIANRSDITSAMRGHYLDDAYRLIVQDFDHPEFQGVLTDTLVASVQSYAPVVTDLFFPTFVKDMTNDRPIDNTGMTKILAQKITSGTPTEYYWWNNVFYFDRIVLTPISIKIWYKVFPAQWAAGSPAFNVVYDPLIPMKAAKLALESVGNLNAAHIQDTEYNNYVSEMRLSTDSAKKNDRRTSMRVRLR